MTLTEANAGKAARQPAGRFTLVPHPKVCIGIPTYKRPGSLRLLLRSLERQQTRAGITVIVADNDSAGREGIAVCREIEAEGYRFPLLALASPERGISPTRNVLAGAALDLADTDCIAMIDDDSWPDPNWIEVLLNMLENLNVDVVRGAMRPDFERLPEPWLVRTGLFQSSFTATGRVEQVHAAGNFLARATVFRNVERPWFDPQYALTGGEDDDFFLRLRERGYLFAHTVDTIVHERMPVSRSTAKWLLERAQMNGASWARVRMRRRPSGWTPQLEMTKLAAGFVFGLVTVCGCFWSRSLRFRGLYKMYRSIGKVRGLRGKQRLHYSTTHGT